MFYLGSDVDYIGVDCSITTGARAEVRNRTAVYGAHVGGCAHV